MSRTSRQPQLVLDYLSSVEANMQVFYSVGQGMQGTGAVRVRRNSQFQEIRLPIGPGIVRALRLDPLDQPGTITLAHLRIVRPGEPDILLPPKAVTAAHQIAALDVIGDTISITTIPTANDPRLRVAIGKPIKAFRAIIPVSMLPAFALWCAFWAALIWVIGRLSKMAARLRIDEGHRRSSRLL